jgi:hypothetical protein
MSIKDISPAYQKFLNFFKLTQRKRLDGLDSTYFSEMTEEEIDKAFEHLKDKFEGSLESIRGLYLCNPDRAISLFKKTLKAPMENRNNKREQEALTLGRVTMAGYICNTEPTKENIDYLANFDIKKLDNDSRSAIYKLLPRNPTTLNAVKLLEQGVLFEDPNDDPSGSAVTAFLQTFGIELDIYDNNYKALAKNLYSENIIDRKKTIEKVKSSYTPKYIN